MRAKYLNNSVILFSELKAHPLSGNSLISFFAPQPLKCTGFLSEFDRRQ